jgi:hypothetical protein
MTTHAAWFAGKIRELGELLRWLPAARQRAFHDALNAPGASQRDDLGAAGGMVASGNDRVTERQ